MSRLTSPPCTRRAFLAGAGAIVASGCVTSQRGMNAKDPYPSDSRIIYDSQGTLLIEAFVNGGPIVRFVIDTGASRSALSLSYAQKIGLAIGDGGVVEGSAGTVRVGSAVADLQVPRIDVLSIDFTISPLAWGDPECVGILGREFLEHAPFQIQYQAGVLTWNAPRPRRGRDRIAMTLDHGIPRIEAVVNDRPLPLRIDTGAALAQSKESYLNLTQDQAQAVGLTGRPAMVFTARGMGGTLELPVHALRSLRIAHRLIPAAFAIVQPRQGYFARSDAVGFIGNSVLDKIDPYMNYANGEFGFGR